MLANEFTFDVIDQKKQTEWCPEKEYEVLIVNTNEEFSEDSREGLASLSLYESSKQFSRSSPNLGNKSETKGTSKGKF